MITIAGGEPLIYPDVINVLDKISKIHDIEVTSNLSIPLEKVNDLSEQLSDRNVRISATFHPLFADLDEFSEKIFLLNEKNLLGGCLFLAYPPQIDRIPEVKKLFNDKNISFSVLTFWGQYEGKDYPESYTDKEKEIIGLSIGSRSNENYQTTP